MHSKPVSYMLGYNHAPRLVCTPIKQLQPFQGVALQAFNMLNGYTDGMLHMLGIMYRWCVAAFSSDLWNIPTQVDQVMDGRVAQTNVNIDALCQQIWPPEQHEGKKSEHMLHLLCHDVERTLYKQHNYQNSMSTFLPGS